MARPLDLLPANPRYFRFRGQPTFLLTSAEHYGAVFNLDFDHVRYLSHLQRHRFNYTRTASGTFVERWETIEGAAWENTQAPRPGRYVGPWARSDEPGYAYGGTRFDLQEWDEAYFERLHDFVRQAGLRGVIVEFTLFTAMYTEAHYDLSPMKAANNVNGVGDVGCQQVYHLDNGGLLEHQLRFVRKVAAELLPYDNVILEVMNEPYFAGFSPEWVSAVLDALEDEFARADRRLLVAWNVANFHAPADAIDPRVSVYDFHYANPPTAVALNHHLAKPVVYDETGYIGVDDEPYRVHAWEFLLAGGSGFNHLDYAYAPGGQEDGSRVLPPDCSGGGSETLRDQYTWLRDFLYALPFATMGPDADCAAVTAGEGNRVHAISAPGRAYACFVASDGAADLTLTVAPGTYRVRVLDPVTGDPVEPGAGVADDGTVTTEGTLVVATAGRRELAVALVAVGEDRTTTAGPDFDFAAAARRTG